jgi:ADP-ribose pyrophosphatase
MPPAPEKLVRRERVYDGVLLKVNRDVVAVSDGSEHVREWIAHPGAAAVVPLFEDGTTLMVRQYRYAPGREFLEVPAGKLDVEGESPAEVAVRELEEETGWTAERVHPLGAIYPCIGYSDEVIHLFVAEGLREGTAAPHPGEPLEPVRLALAEVVRMARAGELADAKSTVAVLRAAVWLEERGRGLT